MPDDPQDQAIATSGEESAAPRKVVLDLLEGKPSRGQRRRQQLEEIERSGTSQEPPPPEPRESALDQAKKNALNLFDDEDKPKKKQPRRGESTSALPRIGGSAIHPPAPAAGPAGLAAGGNAADLADLVKQIAASSASHARMPDSSLPADTGVTHPAAEHPPAQPAEAGAAEVAAPAEPATDEVPTVDDAKVLHLKGAIVLKDLAELMGLRPFHLIKDLLGLEFFARMDTLLELDVVDKVCKLHGFTLERDRRTKGEGVKQAEVVVEPPPPPPPVVEDELKTRAPIITFMGHVDHGKTSLLDAIRQARVAAGEAGGITQHIGAYGVLHNGRPITFLDTPGHAIFTQMRARGATVTDIVVLVVAADDGFMPQTDEALSHAKAANVQLMVAINKCDLPAANIDRVKAQMQDRGIAPDDWGGSTSVAVVSAHTKQGLAEFLDLMLLEAEMLEIKVNPKGPARAWVIEAKMDPGRGPTATVIVRSGTLKTGDPFLCGPYAGKVRSLVNDKGQAVKSAGPGDPVEVVGFAGLPNVGDEVVVMKTERDSKRISEERLAELRQNKLATPERARMEGLFADLRDGQRKTFNVVLKGDVQGSVEAIAAALQDIKSDKIELKLTHVGAGPISENDVMLASTSNAVILGFNVKLESNAVKTAKRENVQVKLYSIVYELIDQVREAMVGMLEPETRETQLGHAKVLQVFKAKKGRAAGCYVQQGRIERKARARVVRGGQVVFDGPIGTLRRFSDEVDEVKAGTECGIRLGDYNDYETDDIIECYQLEKIQQTL
jgi:translation initiation factor IF-2